MKIGMKLSLAVVGLEDEVAVGVVIEVVSEVAQWSWVPKGAETQLRYQCQFGDCQRYKWNRSKCPLTVLPCRGSSNVA